MVWSPIRLQSFVCVHTFFVRATWKNLSIYWSIQEEKVNPINVIRRSTNRGWWYLLSDSNEKITDNLIGSIFFYPCTYCFSFPCPQYTVRYADIIPLREAVRLLLEKIDGFSILRGGWEVDRTLIIQTVYKPYIQTAMKLESTYSPFWKYNTAKQHGRLWSGHMLFTHLYEWVFPFWWTKSLSQQGAGSMTTLLYNATQEVG